MNRYLTLLLTALAAFTLLLPACGSSRSDDDDDDSADDDDDDAANDDDSAGDDDDAANDDDSAVDDDDAADDDDDDDVDLGGEYTGDIAGTLSIAAFNMEISCEGDGVILLTPEAVTVGGELNCDPDEGPADALTVTVAPGIAVPGQGQGSTPLGNLDIALEWAPDTEVPTLRLHLDGTMTAPTAGDIGVDVTGLLAPSGP